METFGILKVSIVLFPEMELQERILAGARDLFIRFAVKSVTMDDIAKQLGVSKKTIYQFFENKEELVSAVMGYYLQDQKNAIDDIAKNSSDPIEEILKMTDYIRATFQNMNPSLLYEIEKYFPVAWEVYREHKKCCIQESIVENLNKGINQGLFRKELDVLVMAKLRMQEIELGSNPLVFSPSKFDFSEVQIQLLDHFLHGICTLKGHKIINKYKHITEEE